MTFHLSKICKPVAAGLLGLALSGAAWAAHMQTLGAPPANPVAGAFANPMKFQEQGGEAIYVAVCTGCHMPGGRGAIGAGAYPKLAGNANLAVGGYPVSLVLHGQKAMPPLGDYFTDQQVADVVNYIRTHFGNDYTDAVTPDEVKAAR